MMKIINNTPYILEKGINEVGCGAMIKNIDTSQKAIIIDFVGQGIPVACTYTGSEENILNCQEKDYTVFKVCDAHKWIVLCEGQDEYVLVE